MKLIHEKFERDGKGSVKCTPETEDDMWDVYNLLKVDDIVHATATRKVKASEMESSGANVRDTSSKVIKLNLGVKVTSIDWDPDLSLVRVSGRNQTVSEYVKQGAMHTLELTTHKAVTIEKSEWDGEDVRRFRKALEPNVQATIVAMLISDVGECRIVLSGGARTTVVAKIERSIPKKKGVGAVVGHEKQLGKFYEDICDAVLGSGSGHASTSLSAAAATTDEKKKKKHFLENCPNCFVIAGPGFGKENILQKLNERSQKLYSGKTFESWLKSSFDCVLVKNVRASSAHVGALLEALKDPSTRKAVGAAAETLDADVVTAGGSPVFFAKSDIGVPAGARRGDGEREAQSAHPVRVARFAIARLLVLVRVECERSQAPTPVPCHASTCALSSPGACGQASTTATSLRSWRRGPSTTKRR